MTDDKTPQMADAMGRFPLYDDCGKVCSFRIGKGKMAAAPNGFTAGLAVCQS
jgi:hypothetical protein